MNQLRLLMTLLLAIFLFAPELRAQQVAPADAEQFQRIISDQITAFRADDSLAAYSYAAPAIKRIFPSPEIFMDMVRQGYRPVYRPRRFEFGDVTEELQGRPTQHVTIIDENGKAWSALYVFERQPDGSWKIIGCSLVQSAGEA
jgi:ketosteroid isomerase-like protein